MKKETKEQKKYCDKCNQYIEHLNELEQEELDNNGAFVCSNCINEEMLEEV